VPPFPAAAPLPPFPPLAALPEESSPPHPIAKIAKSPNIRMTDEFRELCASCKRNRMMRRLFEPVARTPRA
jgi:hypothetical protein